MNKELNNIIKSAQNLKLSENEKAYMKSDIISTVLSPEIQNVTNKETERLYYQWDIVNYLNLIIKQKNFMTALIIAIMLTLSGGTSAIAEKSVPGDVLFPVKVLINEPVAGIFSVSKEGKAVWQERLVERRLEEARLVVEKGNLSTSTQASIENNINNQVDKFTLALKALSEGKSNSINSFELSARIESSLKANQDILNRMVSDINASTTSQKEAKEMIKDLLSSLKENEIEIKSNREKIELKFEGIVNGTSTTPLVAANNKKEVAEKILADVKSKYQELKSTLATSTVNEVEKRLADIDAILATGNADIVSLKFDSAREKFQKVINLTNEVRVNILTNSTRDKIENSMNLNRGENRSVNSGPSNSTSSMKRGNSPDDGKLHSDDDEDDDEDEDGDEDDNRGRRN